MIMGAKSTENWYATEPSGFVNVAVQLPLMLFLPDVPLLPHPSRKKARARRETNTVDLRMTHLHDVRT